jgi:putative aldouronate transport system substrate-binding protein
MIIVLACGCTSSESKTSSEATSQVKPEASASAGTAEKASKYPIAKEKITVTAMAVPTDVYGNDDNKKILWDKIEELTNIHLEVIPIEKEQRSVYLASGEWPDFFIEILNNSEVNSYGVEGGMLANYNDYLEYMPNLKACFEKYPTTKKIVTNTDGTIYQLPRLNIASTSVSARAHYRADVLNELGLKIPTTTDEFHDVLSVIYKAKGKAPLVALMDTNQYEYFLFGAFGEATSADFDSIDGKTVVYNRISEQYKHYLEYVSKLYSEGLLHQEYVTLDGAAINAMAAEGAAVFAYNLQTVTAKDFASGKVEVSTLAPLTSQYTSKQKLVGYPCYNKSGYAINKNSKHIKEICQMLDIAFAKEEVAEGTGLNGEAFIYGVIRQ